MLGLELAFGKWSMSFIVFQAGQSNDFTRSRRSPSPSCPRSMSEKRANHSTLVMKGSCCFSVFLSSFSTVDMIWQNSFLYFPRCIIHLTSEWLPLVAVLFLFCSSAFSFFICIFPFLFSFLVLAFPFSLFLSFFFISLSFSVSFSFPLLSFVLLSSI